MAAAYHRARALCQGVGDTPPIFPVLAGLMTFYVNREEFQTARELGEQMLSLAQRGPDPAHLADAHIELGNALFFLGEFGAARTHLEQGLCATTHLEIFCLARLAQILWYLGYPAQALQQSQEALTLARERAQPATLVVNALNYAAHLHGSRREGHSAYEHAEAALVLAREQGFAFREAEATMLRGWALVEQGQGEAGLTQIRQGIVAERATGGRNMTFSCHAGHGVLARGTERAEGVRVVAEALAIEHSYGEGRWTAELYRLQGELLRSLAAAPHVEAETCFQQALAVARRQQAKVLGAARRHEPEPPVAAAGQARGGPRAAGTDLWLVHRGL